MGNSWKDDSTTDGDTKGGDSPPSNSSLYSEGENVLAYHGPRIYEAKVQKGELREKEWRYFVQYLHLFNSWDEWVGVDRLMKHTEENVMKQQALDKKQGVDKNTKLGRSTQIRPKSSTELGCTNMSNFVAVSKRKKRKNDISVEKGYVSTEKLVKIQIPSTLRKQLVDDWDFVTQQDKLVKLPCSPTVDEVLTKYLEYRSKKDGMCYFDKALPVMLLYKKEHKQYTETVVDSVSSSAIYGAEHLLHLFVMLPELLAYVNIEEETLTHFAADITRLSQISAEEPESVLPVCIRWHVKG
ncbi:MRG family protein isoform 1 [Quillaja saponaria]|uniref:MRG family protein isoform 1 n=1 Tax=Quillaja saponaria TaxID=32244 RepID=A0AAD7P713_QUISA|nr:MRG family protein isoform 1 [Quillaja saponaria]